MFNWTVCNTQQYLGLFNFLDLCETELFEIELFARLTVFKQKKTTYIW